MKTKLFLLLLLLVLGSIPYQTMSSKVDEQEKGTVPAPIFVTIKPDSNPSKSNIYPINETLTLTYTAPRFDVDGIILLGSGSNLTTSFTNPRALNFTRVSSFQEKSTYEVQFNVTSYTIFYAYSWSKVLTNGTIEEFDFDDKTQGHQLWVKKGSQYPIFSDLTNTEIRGSDFYAPIGSNLTFVYTTQDPIDVNNTYVTLVFANKSSELYNESTSIRVNMTQIEFAINNQSKFAYNYTLDQRILFFTAFNAFGWERSDNTNNLRHRITNGFSFNVQYSQNLGKYTEIDDIEFNVTSFNETSEDAFYYRYRVFDNESVEDPLVDWKDVSINDLNISSTLINNTDNFNTSKTIYQVNLGKFNVDQKVEVQSYVEYYTGSYNVSDTPDVIIIKDSRPTIQITSANNTFSRNNNATVIFEFETIRGSILNATLVSNQTDLVVIKNKENYTISFLNSTGAFIQGKHVVIINVTNSIPMFNSTIKQNRSRIAVVIYKIDRTLPVVAFDSSNPKVSDENGYITVKFTYADETAVDSGIKYVVLSWGNGLSINATSLNEASMKYRYAGTYTITLTAYDVVGNQQSTTMTITVSVKTTKTSKTKDSPIALPSIIFSIVIGVLIIQRKRNSQKK